MTNEITLEEALKLVEFEFIEGEWRVRHVKTNVYGSVWCNVIGDVDGSVGSVIGDVLNNVYGNVGGTISGRKWQFVETPKEKLGRLIKKTGNEDLIEAFNQLEDN